MTIRAWRRWSGRLEAGAGLIALLLIWEILAITVFAGRYVMPTPVAMVRTAFHDGFYRVDLATTLWEAARGWAIGNGVALFLALLVLLSARFEGPLLKLGALTYCVPTVAIGPLLVIVLSPDRAKVIMAALSVFFVTLVAAVVGIRSAARSSLDLVHIYGGGALSELRFVRLRAAVPSLIAGLAIAAPAALLGAMLGEYLGGDRGLGVLMVSAQQSLQVSRAWAVGMVATVISGGAFVITTLVGRLLAPEGAESTELTLGERPPRSRLRAVGGAAVGAVAAVVVWAVVLKLAHLNPYYAKTPAAVWHYLQSGVAAAGHRHALLAAMRATLSDAGLGWLFGSAAAIVAAGLIVSLPRLSSLLMPVVVVLRSVPLVAMTPIIALMFGRGVLGITIISGIVTFVPSLVTIVAGLRLAPTNALDLMHAYSARRTFSLRTVRLPYALPSLFSAAKIAMPGALLGAVLAEWLITSHGIGHLMATSIINSDFSALWASVALIGTVSLVLYSAVGAVEAALARELTS
jgi:sulfonate transport system permease protein